MHETAPEKQPMQANGCGGFDRYFLIIMLVVALAGFIWVIRIFLLQIVVAAVFVTLFYPFYRLLNRLMGGRRGWSALACCIVLFVGLMGPAVFIGNLVAGQAAELYQTAKPRVNALLNQKDTGIMKKIQRLPLYRWLASMPVDWRASLRAGANAAGSVAARVINKTSQMTFGFLIDLFIVFFSMFYFFRDGDRIVAGIAGMLPLRPVYRQRLLTRFITISRATVRGTLFIGLIQGTVGGATLLVLGVHTWLLWGVVTVFLSVIPVLGAWTVMVPVGIALMIGGHVWQGITVILISTLILAMIDNILRPVLVGHGAGLHDLLTFFATLGGLSLFGVMGFIIGPMIAALFLTILDIFSVEFQQSLREQSAIP